jgi:hypothetical protein
LKTNKPGIQGPTKFSFKSGEEKNFLKENMKEFITCRPALQAMSKEVLG